ncbi:helix-turn-helix transcriptional regulator [Actinoallomurus iriomotensis]|nr:helix-turn-helix transcriptional regulator [Actinoallomurus iriomotensis]
MNEAELLRYGLRAGNAIIAGEPFETILTDGLRRTVGADTTTLTVWRRTPGRLPTMTVSGPDTPPLDELHAWTTKFGEHPYFAHLLATHDPRSYRTSDLMSFRRFLDTAVYRDLLAHYGLRYQLAATLAFTEQDLVFIGLMRTRRDFSDREVGAVDQLRRMVSAALAFQTEVRAVRATIGLAPADGPHLTEREKQVLRLVAAGHTNDQTATRLGIRTRTVRKHLESVFAKAEVPNRAAAVAWWLRRTGEPDDVAGGAPRGGRGSTRQCPEPPP